jgi:hypothetical protein
MIRSITVAAIALALSVPAACSPGQHRAPDEGAAQPRVIDQVCAVFNSPTKGLDQHWPIIAEASAVIVNGHEETSLDNYPYRRNVRTPHHDVAEVGPGVVVHIVLTCTVPGLFNGWRIECRQYVNGTENLDERDVQIAERTRSDLISVACEYLG